ncbi:MAG: CHRD domain-containing protein [Planctomycetes bacterium]|nr:CHRD domain-containing protein [Planctomycetota bacterium]
MNRSLKRWLRGASMAAVVATLATTTLAQKVCMTAVLDGAQETPPNGSPGKGTAYMLVDRDLNTLTYELAFASTAAETTAHIHGFAGPGLAAGVKFALPLGNHKSGVITYSEADELSILAGLTYFNIHTAAFGGGEIRGQIVRSNAHFTMTASAHGMAEVPPTPSVGRGVGWFRFNTIANSFQYSFTYTGLMAAEMSAHVHGFSSPGVNSGVKIALPLGFHKNGTLAYPAADEASYLAGLAYVNIHTTAFGGGEIRGQMVPGCSNPASYCTGKTNSQGCVPAVGFTGLPTLAAPDDFHVTCMLVINNKSGIMYWGTGPKNAPFGGGTQCVASPVRRTPLQNSGGNPPPEDCSGTFDFHFSDAYMAANALMVGSTIFCEYWYRDPADPATFGLSNALYAEILP